MNDSPVQPSLATRLRWFVTERLLPSRSLPEVQIRLPWEFLGSPYGGFAVAPARIQRGAIVYSCGVGEDASFDREMMARFDARVFAFDPTPRVIAWVGRQTWPEGFRFCPYAVGDFDGRSRFYGPADPAWVSHSLLPGRGKRGGCIEVDVCRLPTLMRQFGHTQIDLLKLDIEGAEYAVLADVLRTGLSIGQIVVEFHHRLGWEGLRRTRAIVRRLRRGGYRLFWISERREEFGFVRGDPA